MWRWLPSVLCNKSSFCFSARRLFFLQLMGIVFAVHVIIFASYGIVGWFSGHGDRFKISLTQSGATYVLMPLQKKVDQRNKKINSGSTHSYKKSNVIDHETYQRKKNARKKSKAHASLKKSVTSSKSKQMAAKNNLAAKKQKSSILMQSDSITKKSLKMNAAKKAVTKIQDSNLEKDEVKEIVPVEQPVALEVEKKVDEPIQKNEEVEKVESLIVKDAEPELASDDDFDEDNVIFVGYEELEQSVVGSKIQHTIQQIWTPPVGMKQDISCEVQVKINGQGQAEQAKVIKPSGVFVYDASARKTLLTIEYPKEVWNKNITILLGSS